MGEIEQPASANELSGSSRARPSSGVITPSSAVPARSAVADAVAVSDTRRLLWLDGLRGIAAACVFVQHVRLPGPEDATIGFDVGVMIFFVLSGYLLYGPLARAPVLTDARVLGAYAIRRIARIVPAYLVALVGVSVLTGWDPPPDPVGILTFNVSPIVVVWTLQIEAVFYILLPAGLLVLRGWATSARIRALAWLGVASIAVGAIGLGTSHTLPVTWAPLLYAFVPGMILAEIEISRPALLSRLPTRWLVVAGIGAIASSVVLKLDYPDLPASIGAALLIAVAIRARDPGLVAGRICAIAGALSYSTYLWQYAVISVVDRPESWWGAGAAAVVTLGVAACVYLLVERPAIALGRIASDRLRAKPATTA